MTSLLVEFQTEELPPKALKKISDAFSFSLFSSLKEQGLLGDKSQAIAFGSPRRIAVKISDVLSKAADVAFEKKLVPVKIGLDEKGKPTEVLLKKISSLGLTLDVEDLHIKSDGKQDQLFYIGLKPGAKLEEALQQSLENSVKHLPIPKMMNYQLEDGQTVQFVRPVKHVIALYGEDIVPIKLFGLNSSRTTIGHRFHTKGAINIKSAENYEAQLENEGKVIPSFSRRKEKMLAELKNAAEQFDADIIMPEELVEEVTALTEWPVVYTSSFDEAFLKVPEECLILTMQQNQKYFALRDKHGRLLNNFLLVSQIEAKDGGVAISGGNARVVRARLSDAKFFYDQDRLQTLSSRVPGLSNVVYHNKLGSQLERTKRIEKITEKIATAIGADVRHASRAAYLAKADLRTLMVGEFPELQGIMGQYYANHDGEGEPVARAIREHYSPRYAGDALPTTLESLSVALADKIETLVGMFGIGQLPTGDKDPYALRRHALGVIRMLIEKKLEISLDELINMGMSEELKVPGVQDATSELKNFFTDRLKVLLKDLGNKTLEIESVLSVSPKLLLDIQPRIDAVRDFMTLPESSSLAAANKRIENILKKSDFSCVAEVDPNLLIQEEEENLYQSVHSLLKPLEDNYRKGNYVEVLRTLVPLKLPVDEFFDKVMVNSEDQKLRENRLALLKLLHNSMNQVAKLSFLSA